MQETRRAVTFAPGCTEERAGEKRTAERISGPLFWAQWPRRESIWATWSFPCFSGVLLCPAAGLPVADTTDCQTGVLREFADLYKTMSYEFQHFPSSVLRREWATCGKQKSCKGCTSCWLLGKGVGPYLLLVTLLSGCCPLLQRVPRPVSVNLVAECQQAIHGGWAYKRQLAKACLTGKGASLETFNCFIKAFFNIYI